jgi:hypothetical protein
MKAGAELPLFSAATSNPNAASSRDASAFAM